MSLPARSGLRRAGRRPSPRGKGLAAEATHAVAAPTRRRWKQMEADGGEADSMLSGRGRLTLVWPIGPSSDALKAWRALSAATEEVMQNHFGAFFCGGCECLENLAGQVLT